MKVKLEVTLDVESVFDEDEQKITTEEAKEGLKQCLFEVCEDWVLKGQQPDLEFSEDGITWMVDNGEDN